MAIAAWPRKRERLGGADRLEGGIDLGVDPADKERRHRRDPGRVVAAASRPRKIGRRHRLVVGEREHQGRVDVDAVGDEALDRRDARGASPAP